MGTKILMEDKNLSEIEKLKKLLTKWDHEYYVLGKPSVSDAEYDRVFETLKKLEPSYIKVSSDLAPSTPLREVPHLVPLLSLDKVYEISDLTKWLDKIPAHRFSIEPKIDGVSIALTYRNGKLELALTRGDGTKGLDVTHNVLLIPGIPHDIESKETLVFRGEIFMTHEDFAKQKEHTSYANPRNLASGMLRRLDLSLELACSLHCFIYQGTRFPNDFSTHEEMWNFLKEHEFPLPPDTHFFEKINDITPFIEELRLARKTLPFDIDGLVIKVDDIAIQKSLGETNHHPKWAMAFKFSPPNSLSEILDITVQVGRTGKITPLAHLKPVIIQGSTVKKATLHNGAFIEALEIGIGDIVSVSKRGDIIPAIEEVVEKKGALWSFPKYCPSCKSLLIKEGANEYCPFSECPDKIKAQLEYFTKTLELVGFGESIISLLYDKFHLRKPQEFWQIPWEKLSESEGYGAKKIQNFLKELERIPKKTSFGELIVALGIPEVSQNIIKLLFKAGYSSLESFSSFSKEALLEIKGIGDKTIARLLEAFSPPSLWLDILKELHQYGFPLSETPSTLSSQNLPLSHTRWVITGTFSHYKPREKAIDIIRTLGGEIDQTITKQTTHLLFGENAGSKLTKAIQKGDIQIISEKDFITLYDKIDTPLLKDSLF